MKQVGILEAKAHLSALVEDAERGESTLITRRGKPVARIVPVDAPQAGAFGLDDGLGFINGRFRRPIAG